MMIDNTHVVVLRGTGPDMVPVPEMVAFADRFCFTFEAHEKGHANRSARVERPFSFIEGNFLAGRVFESWQDLNNQARIWCDKVNASFKKHIRATPIELYATEMTHLKPLPLWIPEPYKLHHRTVDIKGYVNLHTNRYSVPFDWIGHRVEVQETLEHMIITLDHRNQVKHERMVDHKARTISKPGHKPPRGTKRKQLIQEEQIIATSYPELTGYVAALKKYGKKQVTLALRQLLRMAREYPQEPFMSAVEEAARFGLYDGIYVVRTSVEKAVMDTDQAVRGYKLLSNVEQAFRCLTSVDLMVRPIRHRLESRVRAHIFIAVLSYYVQWHMIEAWRPLLFADEDQDAKALRDPVAPAKRSKSALKKIGAKRLDDGSPVHSFQTLLGHLGKIVRNTCRCPNADPEATFHKITSPNAKQFRALDLLRKISL